MGADQIERLFRIPRGVFQMKENLYGQFSGPVSSSHALSRPGAHPGPVRRPVYRSEMPYSAPSMACLSWTISMAAMAASHPLLPAFDPARSMACSRSSVVRTPKETGMFPSNPT